MTILGEDPPQRPPDSNGEIRSDYERSWAEGAAALAAGAVECDPPPREGDERWGLSIVLRPEGRVRERLAAAADELRPFLGERQLLYGPSTLHTTLRSLEAHRGKIEAGDPLLSRYADALRELARSQPLSIAYDGLTLGRSGVLAQGWPLGEGLQRLRDALHSRLADKGLAQSGPERSAPRRTAHASLAVFQCPPESPGALLEHVAARRRLEYGRCDFSHAEIVKYELGAGSLRLSVLESVSLGGR